MEAIMKFTKVDLAKDEYMLKGSYKTNGYDWWWHSFTGRDKLTGQEKPFYIEFFIVNPKIGFNEVHYGELAGLKASKPGYLMINVGSWGGGNTKQLHRFIPLKDVKIKKGHPFEVEAFDNLLNEEHVVVNVDAKEGTVGSDVGTLKADLKIDKHLPFNVGYGTCKLFRDLKAFEMYWNVGGMKTYYEGTIVFDGREYEVKRESSYGYADKNWGKDFTSPWVWLSSNNLTSRLTGKKLENSAFDIGGGKPKAFGITINRQLLSAFVYEGKTFEFNFSKFWTHVKTHFDFKEEAGLYKWHVIQTNRHYKMETYVECKKENMLKIKYEAPSGAFLHQNLYNGGNGVGRVILSQKVSKNKYEVIDDIDCKNIGCEYGEFVNQ
jgi:hypothetical protein